MRRTATVLLPAALAAALLPSVAVAQGKTATADDVAVEVAAGAPAARAAFADYAITRFPSGASYYSGAFEGVAPVDTGFVSGSNFYGDTAKGTFLDLPTGVTSAMLTSVDVMFAYKSGTSTQPLELKVYAGTPDGGPSGDPLTVVSVPLSSVKASTTFPPTSLAKTTIALPTPVTVPASFFVSIEFPDSDPGLISIAKTATAAGRNAYVWERWSDGTWFNLSDAWYSPGGERPGDSGWELAVTANVSTSTAAERGLAADGFGLRLRGAQPVSGRLSVEMGLPTSVPARVALVDVLGRTVATLADGTATAGTTGLSADVSGLAAGVYVVRMEVAGRVATLPVVVR